MNIILLTVDALRYDHLSSNGHHRPTSPNIDEFVSRSAHFQHAYSVSSHTREAIPGMITGQYPDKSSDSGFYLASTNLGEWLQDAGYETGAFHSNPFASRAYGFDDGFDAFDDDLYLGGSRLVALAQRTWDKLRGNHYVRAAEINNRSLNWVDGVDEPFLLWNHYMDVHGPYEPPKDAFEAVNSYPLPDRDFRKLHQQSIDDPASIKDDDRKLLMDLYDGEIRYLDEQIGLFLEELKSRGLLSDSLVVITSDHGEGFGKNGYYSHPRHLYDDLIHIPLAVHSPDIDSGQYETPVSSLDVVPTVLKCATAESGSNLPGRPVQDIITDSEGDAPERIVFSQARAERDGTEVIRYSGRSADGMAYAEWDAEAEELTMLENSGGPEIAEAVKQHAAERNEFVTLPEEDEDLSGDVEERLKVLGYRE